MPAHSNSCLRELELQLKFKAMKTVTMLEFRRDAAAVLDRVARGEELILSHRGKAAAKLVPVPDDSDFAPDDDPLFTIGKRATPSPKGTTDHRSIDAILYGGDGRT